MMRSRMFAAGVAIAAVGAGVVGGAVLGLPTLSAASSNSAHTLAAAPTTTTVPGKGRAFRRFPGRDAADSPLIAAAAKALNLTPQQLLDKLQDGKTTIADVAQQQHVDVNTVINAIAAADKDRISKIVNSPWPLGPVGPNGGALPKPGDLGPFIGRKLIGQSADTVANALHITTDQLKTDLQSGKSIADIARSKGIDVNSVINTLVADASSKVDQAVAAGKLTTQQATAIKSHLQTAITNLVNNNFPKFPGGRFGFGGGPVPGPTP